MRVVPALSLMSLYSHFTLTLLSLYSRFILTLLSLYSHFTLTLFSLSHVRAHKDMLRRFLSVAAAVLSPVCDMTRRFTCVT